MIYINNILISGYCMQTASLFMNGKSQSVRIPKEFRFEGERVIIKRSGNAVVLLPEQHPWDVLFESLNGFSDDFMKDGREQGEQKREELLP